MNFASLMGGMGAPPAAMGRMSFDVPSHTQSHEDAVEDLAELHVMRCVMRLGRKIHLLRWKNRLRKMRTKTRKMIDVSFIYVLNFSLHFELGWMNLWA